MMGAADESMFVTKPEAAALLGVSVRTLERLVATGRFPPPIRLGRQRRWVRKALLRWIESGCRGTR